MHFSLWMLSLIVKKKITEKENVLIYHIKRLKVESHIISIDTGKSI